MEPVIVTMVLGLGSNLGDREGLLREALSRLAKVPGIEVAGAAPVYQTPPFGGPEQGPYLNSAALVRARLSPREVLAAALAVERSLGRVRPDPVRWGPRTIDIDVLWIEGVAVREDDLVVPHPRLRDRVFALRPLVDLVPGARDPETGEAYAALPAMGQSIERWGDPPQIDA